MNRVAIYGSSDFKYEAKHFKPTDVVVTYSSRVIKAPVEGGATSFDNKVVDPLSIKITGKIDVSTEQGQLATKIIAEMFEMRDFQFFSCTTKDGAYSNLILQNVSSKEDSNAFDTVVYELDFVEALIVQGSEKKPKDKENSNYSMQGNKNKVQIA